MGAIISLLAIAIEPVKKFRQKQKAKKASKQSSPQQAQGAPPPFDHTHSDAVEGLRVEHLATSPPPTTASTAQAPLPTATTTPTTTTNKGTVERKAGPKGKMATDEEYAAFLDKVNQDPNEGISKPASDGKITFKAVDDKSAVPKVLKKATEDAFYVSDADEPFEAVSLNLSSKDAGLPDEATFAELVGHPRPKEADVSILDIGEWDVQGQYKEIVEATREATKGSDVRVYRIGRGGSRLEYWVVGVEGGKLLGARALAIES